MTMIMLTPVQDRVTLRNSPTLASRTIVRELRQAEQFELLATVQGDTYQTPLGSPYDKWYQVKKDGEVLYVAVAWVVYDEIPDETPDIEGKVFIDLPYYTSYMTIDAAQEVSEWHKAMALLIDAAIEQARK